MSRFRFFGLFLIIVALQPLVAQEFRCSVQLNYQKLQASAQQYSAGDTKVFERMKQALEDYVNGRRWTNIDFEQQERLDCSISLILTEQSSATDFKGQLQIQLRAPTYNSNYTSGLFNYLESDFQFTFNESQPLDFEANTYFSNLSSTVAYYLYVMLGIYFDAYGPDGGIPFFEMAYTVCQTAESQGGKGWKGSDSQKARYWFVENHTNSAYEDLHKVYYTYQRLGLDMMTKDQPQARKNIIQALTLLRDVHKVRTNLLSVTQFVDVKVSELVSIFTPAPPEEQKQVYALIKEVSPLNAQKLKGFATK
ncbi:MAG: DUF4835 family protein [Bacteroidales bacterium]|nr:DUF4835 family protein [Candidatus Colimorpha onthohippi]